jgi:trehalose 6-phosphate synthase
MRLSLRFVVPLFLALAALAYAVVPLLNELTLRWFVRDLEMRSELVAHAVEEPLRDLIDGSPRSREATQRVQGLFSRVMRDERLLALGYCRDGAPLYRTDTFPSDIACTAEDLSPLQPGR